MAVTWSGQLVFDVVVFVLTLWKSYCLRSPARGVVEVLLRDGGSSIPRRCCSVTYPYRRYVFRVRINDICSTVGSKSSRMVTIANGLNIVVLLVSLAYVFLHSRSDPG